jgi:hypothetical protein
MTIGLDTFSGPSCEISGSRCRTHRGMTTIALVPTFIPRRDLVRQGPRAHPGGHTRQRGPATVLRAGGHGRAGGAPGSRLAARGRCNGRGGSRGATSAPAFVDLDRRRRHGGDSRQAHAGARGRRAARARRGLRSAAPEGQTAPSSTGWTAARPASTSWCCCAGAITAPFTRAWSTCASVRTARSSSFVQMARCSNRRPIRRCHSRASNRCRNRSAACRLGTARPWTSSTPSTCSTNRLSATKSDSYRALLRREPGPQSGRSNRTRAPAVCRRDDAKLSCWGSRVGTMGDCGTSAAVL